MKNNIKDITKRDFMSRLALVMGAGASAAVLNLAAFDKAIAYTLRENSELQDGVLFSKAQMQTLKALVDVILPKTDTPSASSLDCHGFIDHQLKACHSKQEQNDVLALINALETYSRQQQGKSFQALPVKTQHSYVSQIDSGVGVLSEYQISFRLFKYLCVFGYFTTEYAATQILNYDAVPGGFIGSIKVNKNTKPDGAHDFY